MTASPWQLSGDRAVLTGPLTAVLHLAAAQPGLESLEVAGQSYPAARVLSLDLAAPAEGSWSAYIRGRDLVATYEETPERPLRVQAYWRTGWADRVPGVLAGIDLEVSVQTSRLDGHPRLGVRSTWPAQGAWQHRAGEAELAPWSWIEGPVQQPPQAGFVLRASQPAAASYVEIMHPADFQAAAVSHAGAGQELGYTLEHALFGSDLEKGVILRGRVRAAWVSPEADERMATEIARALTAAPLPLTT